MTLKTTKYICNKLEEYGIVVENFGPVTKLHHNLDEEEFNKVVIDIMDDLALKGQDDNWIPGTPTGDQADWGFYVCPIIPSSWELGDFDMLITMTELFIC